jgi:hypothetical protein
LGESKKNNTIEGLQNFISNHPDAEFTQKVMALND